MRSFGTTATVRVRRTVSMMPGVEEIAGKIEALLSA
jgi:hypothetical protein